MAKNMKKRIFAGLLVLVMVAALFPVTAFAVANDMLTKFHATFKTPQVGETLDYNPQTDADPQENVTSKEVTWYKISESDYNNELLSEKNWSITSDNETVQSGYLYKAMLKVKLVDNTYVGQLPSIQINGKDLELDNDLSTDNAYKIGGVETNSCFYMTRVFSPIPAATPLTKCEATITVPQVGTTFDYAPQVDIDPDDSASIKSVAWYKTLKADYDYEPGATNEWIEITQNATAEDGYLYKIVIKMSIDDGYAVTSNTEVSLNGVGLAPKANSDSGCWTSDNYFYMSSFFLPTAEPKELTKLAATTKIPYIGKTLDYAPEIVVNPQDSVSFDSVTWYKTFKADYDYEPGATNSWTAIDRNAVAEDGYLYKIVIKMSMPDGYTFAQDAEVSSNESGLAIEVDSDRGYWIGDDNYFFVSDYFTPATEKPTPEPTKPVTLTAEPTKATDSKVTGAKTGDANDMTMWIVLLAAGMAIGTSVVVKRKHSGK